MTYIAKGVQLVGDVQLGRDVSVWYNSVLRADIAPITVGDRTNIQDGSVIHVDEGVACVIGEDVTVGHGCVLHACTIEDGVLIGMGAIVLSGAVIQKGAVIGAGAVVKENMVVAPGQLVVGVPGRPVKVIEGSYQKNVLHAGKYVELAARGL